MVFFKISLKHFVIFFFLFEYLCSLNQTSLFFSLNQNFCLNHGFIIESNFSFRLVGIFVRTIVSLQSQTFFLLSWNEPRTGFFLSNLQRHVIILNRDLIIESNFCVLRLKQKLVRQIDSKQINSRQIDRQINKQQLDQKTEMLNRLQ